MFRHFYYVICKTAFRFFSFPAYTKVTGWYHSRLSKTSLRTYHIIHFTKIKTFPQKAVYSRQIKARDTDEKTYLLRNSDCRKQYHLKQTVLTLLEPDQPPTNQQSMVATADKQIKSRAEKG